MLGQCCPFMLGETSIDPLAAIRAVQFKDAKKKREEKVGFSGFGELMYNPAALGALPMKPRRRRKKKAGFVDRIKKIFSLGYAAGEYGGEVRNQAKYEMGYAANPSGFPVQNQAEWELGYAAGEYGGEVRNQAKYEIGYAANPSGFPVQNQAEWELGGYYKDIKVPMYGTPAFADTSLGGLGVGGLGLLSLASAAASAYHGYKRHGDSLKWAAAWGAAGAFLPVVTPAVAVYQGFGQEDRQARF